MITGLGTLITFLINKYVKNDKLKTILSSLNETVRNATSEVYQTYVEALKDEDLFDMDFSKNNKWMPDHTEMEKDIIRFMGYAIVELRKENKDLFA